MKTKQRYKIPMRETDDERFYKVPVSFAYKKQKKVHLQCFDQLNDEDARRRHRKAELEVERMNQRLETVRCRVSQRLGSAVRCKVLTNDVLWLWRDDVVAISMARREFDHLMSNPEGLAKLIAERLR